MRAARADASRFFIGIDSNAQNLAEISRKAARKPKKGGLENVLFVRANVEDLPSELDGLISQVSIQFPWGSLLNAVLLPDPAVLAGIRRICRPDAQLRIVIGYHEVQDAKVARELDLEPLSEAYLNHRLGGQFRQAGFAIKVRELRETAVRAMDTTWAKRLSFGIPRSFFEIVGRIEAHLAS